MQTMRVQISLPTKCETPPYSYATFSDTFMHFPCTLSQIGSQIENVREIELHAIAEQANGSSEGRHTCNSPLVLAHCSSDELPLTIIKYNVLDGDEGEEEED